MAEKMVLLEFTPKKGFELINRAKVKLNGKGLKDSIDIYDVFNEHGVGILPTYSNLATYVNLKCEMGRDGEWIVKDYESVQTFNKGEGFNSTRLLLTLNAAFPNNKNSHRLIRKRIDDKCRDKVEKLTSLKDVLQFCEDDQEKREVHTVLHNYFKGQPFYGCWRIFLQSPISHMSQEEQTRLIAMFEASPLDFAFFSRTKRELCLPPVFRMMRDMKVAELSRACVAHKYISGRLEKEGEEGNQKETMSSSEEDEEAEEEGAENDARLKAPIEDAMEELATPEFSRSVEIYRRFFNERQTFGSTAIILTEFEDCNGDLYVFREGIMRLSRVALNGEVRFYATFSDEFKAWRRVFQKVEDNSIPVRKSSSSSSSSSSRNPSKVDMEIHELSQSIEKHRLLILSTFSHNQCTRLSDFMINNSIGLTFEDCLIICRNRIGYDMYYNVCPTNLLIWHDETNESFWNPECGNYYIKAHNELDKPMTSSNFDKLLKDRFLGSLRFRCVFVDACHQWSEDVLAECINLLLKSKMVTTVVLVGDPGLLLQSVKCCKGEAFYSLFVSNRLPVVFFSKDPFSQDGDTKRQQNRTELLKIIQVNNQLASSRKRRRLSESASSSSSSSSLANECDILPEEYVFTTKWLDDFSSCGQGYLKILRNSSVCIELARQLKSKGAFCQVYCNTSAYRPTPKEIEINNMANIFSKACSYGRRSNQTDEKVFSKGDVVVISKTNPIPYEITDFYLSEVDLTDSLFNPMDDPMLPLLSEREWKKLQLINVERRGMRVNNRDYSKYVFISVKRLPISVGANGAQTNASYGENNDILAKISDRVIEQQPIRFTYNWEIQHLWSFSQQTVAHMPFSPLGILFLNREKTTAEEVYAFASKVTQNLFIVSGGDSNTTQDAFCCASTRRRGRKKTILNNLINSFME